MGRNLIGGALFAHDGRPFLRFIQSSSLLIHRPLPSSGRTHRHVLHAYLPGRGRQDMPPHHPPHPKSTATGNRPPGLEEEKERKRQREKRISSSCIGLCSGLCVLPSIVIPICCLCLILCLAFAEKKEEVGTWGHWPPPHPTPTFLLPVCLGLLGTSPPHLLGVDGHGCGWQLAATGTDRGKQLASPRLSPLTTSHGEGETWKGSPSQERGEGWWRHGLVEKEWRKTGSRTLGKKEGGGGRRRGGREGRGRGKEEGEGERKGRHTACLLVHSSPVSRMYILCRTRACLRECKLPSHTLPCRKPPCMPALPPMPLA